MIKSAIETRKEMDDAIATYIEERLFASRKEAFTKEELDQILQHYHNFINAVHEFIIKKETN